MNWQQLIYHSEIIYKLDVNYALRQTWVPCPTAALGFSSASGKKRLHYVV
ncbi:YccS/YhfK family integral membrane protein [Yersinia aldovae]|nr:YccS/YhfK family integral membrane protein [Yersinia aldovae]